MAPGRLAEHKAFVTNQCMTRVDQEKVYKVVDFARVAKERQREKASQRLRKDAVDGCLVWGHLNLNLSPECLWTWVFVVTPWILYFQE